MKVKKRLSDAKTAKEAKEIILGKSDKKLKKRLAYENVLDKVANLSSEKPIFVSMYVDSFVPLSEYMRDLDLRRKELMSSRNKFKNELIATYEALYNYLLTKKENVRGLVIFCGIIGDKFEIYSFEPELISHVNRFDIRKRFNVGPLRDNYINSTSKCMHCGINIGSTGFNITQLNIHLCEYDFLGDVVALFILLCIFIVIVIGSFIR